MTGRSGLRRPRGTLHDLSHFTSLSSDAAYLCCLSDRDVYVLTNLLELDAVMRSRWYTDVSNDLYTPAKNSEMDAVVAWRDLLLLRLAEMACITDLSDVLSVKLTEIRDAIFASTCCGGTGTSGQFPEAPLAFEDTGSNYPTGYTDRAEWDTARCNLAGELIANLVTDFDNLRVLQVAGLGAEAIAALLVALMLTPLAFTGVLEIATGILALAGLGIGVFVTACEELADRIAAMDVCELYGATTAEEALSNVEDWIAGGTYTTSALTISLGQALVSTDAVNPLFDELANLAVDPAELDAENCSLCDACAASMISGTGDPDAGGLMTSEDVGGGQYQIHFNTDSPKDVTLSSLTGWTEYTGGSPDAQATDTWRNDACDGTFPGWDESSEDAPPPLVWTSISRLVIRSNTSFTFIATIEEPA